MSEQERGRILHRDAMSLMDEYDRLLRTGKDAEARLVALDALQLEKRALASALAEPFRSFVYRSAASIALDAGRMNEALTLVAEALAGSDVPEPICFQLKDISRIARERAHAREPRANESSTEPVQPSRARIVTVSSRDDMPILSLQALVAKG